LASLGYEILSAQDGTEGVEIFRRENARISFTVLDLQTPVMDGNRAIEEIRKIDPAAKIVLSTRSGGDEDVDRFREMGAAAVLSKPYSYGEIVRVAGLFPATAPSPLPVQEK
ncbi:MAG TPA: response regulator, partial [Candidatus Deferrimicrobiaceae bacterium]